MSRNLRRGLATLLLALAMVLAACGGEFGGPTSAIFAAPPWTGAEDLTYNLVQRGGNIYGTCTLQTRPGAEPGRTQLNRLCSDGPYRDDGSVIADSLSLVPFSSLRVVTDGTKDKRRTHSSNYGEGAVHMETNVDGDLHTADRKLPQPDRGDPAPGWYDDEELLWLVRGIPLQEGWKGAYHNVSAAIGRLFVARLEVEGTETIRVPAGEFESWKVRLTTASIEQLFWIEVAAPHRVVRARIERLTYELTSAN